MQTTSRPACGFCRRRKVLVRHMLPNALLPLITIAGINLGLLLGGTVVTETVFSWPGVGRLIVQSVSQRDYPVITGVFLIVGVSFVLVLMKPPLMKRPFPDRVGYALFAIVPIVAYIVAVLLPDEIGRASCRVGV